MRYDKSLSFSACGHIMYATSDSRKNYDDILSKKNFQVVLCVPEPCNKLSFFDWNDTPLGNFCLKNREFNKIGVCRKSVTRNQKNHRNPYNIFKRVTS